MLVRQAEESFKRGIEALSTGRPLEALALLESAIEIERRHGVEHPQARYLSYYGLCLGLHAGRLREGIRRCRTAMELEFFNADLCCNLGRLLVEAGRRREAYLTLRKGLEILPGHPGIQRELARMGTRRPPTVPFLARGNPLNVLLGKLTRSGPVEPARPSGDGRWDPDGSAA